MRSILSLCGMAAAIAAPFFARQTGVPAVDSANVARTAWRAATTALQRNDLAAALREVERAATAWPTQEAYVWGRAVIAVRANDTSAVVRALTIYAATGFGRDVRADSRFTPFLRTPAATRALTRLDQNRLPLIRSTVRATLPDSTFWPEGLDVDPRSGTLYVTSVRHRTIAEVSRDGASVRELIPRDTPGIGAILAVRVDTARGVLWATTSGLPQMNGYRPADSTIAALIRIRLRDGMVERRWDLPLTPNGHTIGDVALAANGDVFITDSSDPVLYRLRSGADTLDRFTHPLFRSLQGTAPTVDGRSVYIADWSHGLLKLDLATRRVMRLADAPNSSSLGCDGIALHLGAIIGVQNGSVPQRVMRFSLDAAGDRIVAADVIDRNTAIATEPTIGTVVGNAFVYVANSQWDEHDDAGAVVAGAVLRRGVVLTLPLGRPSGR